MKAWPFDGMKLYFLRLEEEGFPGVEKSCKFKQRKKNKARKQNLSDWILAKESSN